MRGVPRSGELRRIAALPRRDWRDWGPTPAKMATDDLRTPMGTMALRPVQAAMLCDIYDQQGLFAPVGVGHGKTLVTLLAPVVLEAERPVLFVPAQLKEQTLRQVIPEMSKHWVLHPNLQVVSYSTLSIAKHARLLWDLNPDLIIADECHMLKARTSARTRRFLRYFREHPETMLIALSGTVTKRSLLDYHHIIRLALRDGAPLPRDYGAVVDWDDALAPRDPDSNYERTLAPGALRDFCQEDEDHRQGFRRRLVETPGVVATEDQAIDASIVVTLHTPPVPPSIQTALDDLERTWRTPGGEEITEAVRKAGHAKELAAGFYYKWVWPGGEINHRWLNARSDWHSFAREVLQRRFKGIDSLLQVAQAAESGRVDFRTFEAWCAVRDEYKAVTEPVWVSDYMIKWVVDAVGKMGPTLVWVWHDAVGKAVQRAGIEYIGGGREGSIKVLDLDGSKTVALSGPAHHTGKNLQMFSNNLLTTCPSSGMKYEQLLGRTHRIGQESDQVNLHVIANTPDLLHAMEKAREESAYIETTTGQMQKLNIARIVQA